MPSTNIVFSPSVDERQLDRETDSVNKQLQSVGEDVPVTFDAEEMDGLAPAGGGGLRGGGGAGRTGAAAGIASRLPKPIAGVTAASAMPVALAGGVGLGMLSAMHSASARLQTSTTLLGQAWNAIWRPLGDRLDQLFIRDVAMDILETSRNWEDAIRSGDWFTAGEIINDAIKTSLDWSQYINPIMWPQLLGRKLGDKLVGFLRSSWPGWPDLPDVPDWGTLSPGVPDWSTLVPDMPNWGGISLNLPDWLRRWTSGSGSVDEGNQDPTVGTEPTTMPRDTSRDYTGGTEFGGGTSGGLPKVASGGRIGRTGAAIVHRGELVADRERLVSELANAIGTGGGGGRTVDMSSLERKLDEVNRNLKRLQSMAGQSIEVDGETLGRVTTDARRNKVADTDPTI